MMFLLSNLVASQIDPCCRSLRQNMGVDSREIPAKTDAPHDQYADREVESKEIYGKLQIFQVASF